MKKIIVIFIFLFIIQPVNVHANDEDDIPEGYDSIEQYIHGKDYYSVERIAARNEKIKKSESYLNNKREPRVGYDKTLPVKPRLQETNYWCGPASVQMVIEYKKGILISQSILANNDNLKTTAAGTIVANVASVLRTRTGLGFEYVLETQYSVWNATVTDVDANCPLIYNVKGSYLPNYLSTDGGHYIVGNGYGYWTFGTGSQQSLYYVDPWNGRSGSFGQHEVAWTIIRDGIRNNNGYYIW